MVRIYHAESENLSRKFLVDEVFSKYVGKNCAGVFHPLGFSSSGKVIVTAGPFFEVGEEQAGGRLLRSERGILAYRFCDSHSQSTSR